MKDFKMTPAVTLTLLFARFDIFGKDVDFEGFCQYMIKCPKYDL
jgi:hypothetical protein